jgi:hypothetical protein
MERANDELRFYHPSNSYFKSHPDILAGYRSGNSVYINAEPEAVREFLDWHAYDRGLWSWNRAIRRRPEGGLQPPASVGFEGHSLPTVFVEIETLPDPSDVDQGRLLGDWWLAAGDEEFSQREFYRIETREGRNDSLCMAYYQLGRRKAGKQIEKRRTSRNIRLFAVDSVTYLASSENAPTGLREVQRIVWDEDGFTAMPMSIEYFDAHPDQLPNRRQTNDRVITATPEALKDFLKASQQIDELWDHSRSLRYRRRDAEADTAERKE